MTTKTRNGILLLLILLVGCAPRAPGAIEVHFCPGEDCAGILAAFITAEDDVVCALYGLSDLMVIDALRHGARVVVDHGARRLPVPAREYRKAGLMHNKFCASREAVVTGSYNPTADTAANALLVIQSEALARSYRAEFDELWRGMEGGTPTTRAHTVVDGTPVTVAFCPEDDCQEAVLKELRRARRSIRFMLFTFTDDAIGDLLLRKAAAGIAVEGVLDAGQLGPHSEARKLASYARVLQGIHHKTFIIDDETVITGSYNPTRAGDTKNDENLLIIRDAAIAAAFTAELGRLTQGTRQV